MNLKKILKNLLVILITTLLYACTEDIPKYGEVLYVDSEARTVSYKKVEITGLSSLSELSGKRFNYLLNAKVTENVSEYAQKEYNPNTATVDEFNELTYQDHGEAASLRYRVKDDTIIPYSIEDSILLTLHYNLQKSLDFFESIGLNLEKGINGDSFGRMNIHLEANFESFNPMKEKFESMKDNAVYYSLLNILAFIPQDKLKHLALVSNPMVVTHELSHGIFAYAAVGVVRGSDKYSSLLTDPNNCTQVENEYYKNSMNEGFSDYWAARITGSADLFYLSITKGEMEVGREPNQDRTLENNRVLTSDMFTDCDLAYPSYYWGGTIWASAMWEAEKTSGIEDFDKYLLQSYTCLNQEFNKHNARITFATQGNCFVKTLKSKSVSTEKITKVCDIMKRRYSIIEGELNECN